MAQKARNFMQGYGYLNPGNYSPLLGAFGGVIATYHLTKEARFAYALNESPDRVAGRLASKFWQSSWVSVRICTACGMSSRARARARRRRGRRRRA